MTAADVRAVLEEVRHVFTRDAAPGDLAEAAAEAAVELSLRRFAGDAALCRLVAGRVGAGRPRKGRA